MGGRKQNGVNDKCGGRASGRNDIRAAEICGEGYYGVFRADGVRENVWASSDNTGVFEKTTEMAGRCWWGVVKMREI